MYITHVHVDVTQNLHEMYSTYDMYMYIYIVHVALYMYL